MIRRFYHTAETVNFLPYYERRLPFSAVFPNIYLLIPQLFAEPLNTGLVKIMLTVLGYFSPADIRALNRTVARRLLC
jgi:hypothetical protein